MKLLLLSLPFVALLASAPVFAQETPASAAPLATGAVVPPPAEVAGSSSILLVDRTHAVPAGAPVRGQSSAQVQAKYGEPSQKLSPAGGQKKQWPTINRWVYPQFTVYFEKDKVIDVVVNQASAGEVGPAPVAASHAKPAHAPHPKKMRAAPKPVAKPATEAAPAAATQSDAPAASGK